MPSYTQLREVKFREFTTAERDAEWPNPPNNLVIFNTTTIRLEIYIGETWQAFVEGPDAEDITYTPGVLTDWDGDADPGDLDDALDQLAERVDDIAGGSVLEATLTTRGDLLARDTSGPVRLPLGSSGAFLYSDGQDTKWTDEEKFRYDEELGALIEGVRLHGSVLKLPVLDDHPEEDTPETDEPQYGSLYIVEDDELWYMDPDGRTFRVVQTAAQVRSWVKAPLGRSIEFPRASENRTLRHTVRAVTIKQVNDVVIDDGGGSPSVTWNIYFAAARNEGSPSKLWNANRTTTSEADAETDTFDDATIPAGSWIWYITSASADAAEHAFNLDIQEDKV